MSLPASKLPENSEALVVDDLGFTYHDGSVPALKSVSFTQMRGEVIGVMGASGAGKSTLAKCLNRIIPEFEGGDFRGAVRIAGRDVAGMHVHDLSLEIGMVFQDFESQLFSTTVAHEVAFAMEQAGVARDEMRTRIAEALEAVGLSGFEERDPSSLSGGQKQRLAIASVLALRPRVIVLDEPTTDLDPEGRAEVFALLGRMREHGLSLIVIEHESTELRSCDRLILLAQGEVVAQGLPESMLAQLEVLERNGVHPPSLNRVLALLGIGGNARNIDEAETIVRSRFPSLPRVDHVATKPALAASADPPPLLEIDDISFAYPDGPKALDGVSLRIEPGEFVAIVGQNGSGKTTLAKQIVGLLKPDTGRITLEGRDRAMLHPAETAREVAYVFQNPDHQIFADSVEEEIRFGPRNFGLAPDEIEKRCDEVLRAVGLQHERASDPFLLSKGQRQRVAVASVLALRPRLLILDEPTTGLDYREQRRMMQLVTELNASGVAIVIITHTPWLVAEYARRVVLMRTGRALFDGPVRDFFAQDELLRTSSFRPPEVTALSRRFGTIALTPLEFADWVWERTR